jgi:hypothetical protein
MGRYAKDEQSSLLKLGAFILSEHFKIALKLDAKRMHCLIKLNKLRGF